MKHNIELNTLGGSFCKRCNHWSNLPDGLEGEECEVEVIKILGLMLGDGSTYNVHIYKDKTFEVQTKTRLPKWVYQEIQEFIDGYDFTK